MSTIAVGYVSNESERLLLEIDSENWQLQGRYHNRSQGWFVRAGLAREESATQRTPTNLFTSLEIGDGFLLLEPAITTSQTDTDSNYYLLGLGRYFGARTALSLTYTRTERDADTRTTSCFGTVELRYRPVFHSGGWQSQ